jgi:biotin carboxylase
MKKILILGAGPFQVPAIKKAKEVGIFTIVCSNNHNDPGMVLADEAYSISTLDKEKVLRVSIKNNINGIMTIASDISVPTVAYVAEKLNLPGIKYDTAIKVTNKSLFREFLKLNKVPTPDFCVTNDENEAVEFYKKLSKPAIMKPVFASGSRGVTFINSVDNIKDNFYRCIGSSFGDKSIIIEEFYEGTEVGGEAIIYNKEIAFFQITNKYLNSFYVPTGHSLPSKLNLKHQTEIKDLIKSVINILNIESSPINFDIMLTKDGPRIIEMACRLGGNCLPILMKFSTGIDTIKANISIAIGENPNINKPLINRPFGYKILGSYKSGILEYITPIEKLKKLYPENIEEINYGVKTGDYVEIFNQGSHNVGNILLKGETVEEIETISCEIDSRLTIKLKEI